MTARITELRIAGLRTLADVVLPLDGLTVLIGTNGSGKSSLIEGIELLRKLSEPSFYSLLHEHHGGLLGLLRWGAHELSLAARLSLDDGVPHEYAVVLAPAESWAVVKRETLTRLDTNERLIDRDASGARSVWAQQGIEPRNTELIASMLGRAVAPLRALTDALSRTTGASASCVPTASLLQCSEPLLRRPAHEQDRRLLRGSSGRGRHPGAPAAQTRMRLHRGSPRPLDLRDPRARGGRAQRCLRLRVPRSAAAPGRTTVPLKHASEPFVDPRRDLARYRSERCSTPTNAASTSAHSARS